MLETSRKPINREISHLLQRPGHTIHQQVYLKPRLLGAVLRLGKQVKKEGAGEWIESIGAFLLIICYNKFI